MIFLLVLIVAGLLLTWFFEEYPWQEELEMRCLIRESRENERRRMRHRGTKYIQCGWKPPYTKRIHRKRRKQKPTALDYQRNMA